MGVALAALAVANWAAEARAWGPVNRYAKEFAFDVRRPDFVESARAQPSADLGAIVLADAAVRDEIGAVKWSEMDEASRDAWLASFEKRTDELRAARVLMLDSVARRPGWAFSRFLVGQLSYLEQRRERKSELIERPEEWIVALEAAESAAPGSDAIRVFLAGGFLDTWDRLPAKAREEAPAVIARALRDPEFVRTALLTAAAELGEAQVAAMVPDEPGPLRVARDQFAGAGKTRAAVALHGRWERAEHAARAADLAKLEERVKRGDADGLRAGCRAYAALHPVGEFDDTLGRRQAARLLEIWPNEAAGKWRDDPRGALVRYFLAGREGDVPGRVVERAVQSLVAAPDVVRARAALMGGDRYGWGRMLHDSQTVGSLEWTPFFTALAMAELKDGKVAEAREALGMVAAPAQTECEVLLARRALARKEGKSDEVAETLLEVSRNRPVGFSEAGSVSLCVDPEADAARTLQVAMESPREDRPALASWGFDGGIRETLVVEPGSPANVAVPLSGLSGRVTLTVRGAKPKLEPRGQV